jgi:hypothetical protein
VVLSDQGSDLIEAVTLIEQLTMPMASQVLQILTALQKLSSAETAPTVLARYAELRKAMVSKLTIWLKSHCLSPLLFSQAFEWLASSMNGLPYEFHIFFIHHGVRHHLLRTLSRQHKQRLGPYALYLLCLMLTLRSKEPEPQIVLPKIKTELGIFCLIASVVV